MADQATRDPRPPGRKSRGLTQTNNSSKRTHSPPSPSLPSAKRRPSSSDIIEAPQRVTRSRSRGELFVSLEDIAKPKKISPKQQPPTSRAAPQVPAPPPVASTSRSKSTATTQRPSRKRHSSPEERRQTRQSGGKKKEESPKPSVSNKKKIRQRREELHPAEDSSTSEESDNNNRRTRSKTKLKKTTSSHRQSRGHKMADDEPEAPVPSTSARPDDPDEEGGGARGGGTPPPARAGPAGLALADMFDIDIDQDMGRLQALLEARGLPSTLFSSLGPRMHQMLQRTMSNGSVVKAQQLLQALEDPDEATQLTAVLELCQLLVMGNEDTLAGFPIKMTVTCLAGLLHKDHNYELIHNTCRAITYLMEALPRATSTVAEVIPALLAKLQVIECMDVAEQAISALELLSVKHGKQILTNGGVGAVLMYIDFFSLPAQRGALKITMNCAQFVQCDDLQHLRDHLPALSTKLTSSDKKSVDNVAVFFCFVVDNFHNNERILKEISAHGMLTNLQQVLVCTPPLLSSATFIRVIRMLVVMSSSCPDLAVVLLKINYADTLCQLLVASSGASPGIELVNRSPQEMFELVALAGELMPRLPLDGLFSVNSMLLKSWEPVNESVIWQWKDDQGNSHPYVQVDCSILETAYSQGDDEVNLTVGGRSYCVDFGSMLQINEDTGTSRAVSRIVQPSTNVSTVASAANRPDSRQEVLQENQPLADSCVKTLFPVIYQVYCGSAGPSVRHRCLNTVLRMIYYSAPETLEELLASVSISSQVATMLSSTDLKVVVAGVQLSYILMEKLNKIFTVYFCREGVMHQFQKLSTMDVTSAEPPSPSSSSAPQQQQQQQVSVGAVEEEVASSSSKQPTVKLSDVLKRKKAPKRAANRTEPSPSTSRTKVKAKGFLAHLNPSRWGRSTPTNQPPPPPASTTTAPGPQASGNKEKIRTWIKQQAALFCTRYFTAPHHLTDLNPALSTLNHLVECCQNMDSDLATSLTTVREILVNGDCSPFEVIHSGLVERFVTVLTGPQTLRTLLHVFTDLPPAQVYLKDTPQPAPALTHLVSKLLACLHHLEQFQVKVHDLPGAGQGQAGNRALRFFNSHQLKCNLVRHPDCRSVRQWKSGPVKIDPLALVQAVEKYLLHRGIFRRPRAGDDDVASSDDISDDDDDDDDGITTLAPPSPGQRLEFYINDRPLAPNMTVYQAVRLFSTMDATADTDTDSDMNIANIWTQTHNIVYRQATVVSVPAGTTPSTTAKTSKSDTSAKKTPKHKKDLLWNEGQVPSAVSPLDSVVGCVMPSPVLTGDPGAQVLQVLRLLYALNAHWTDLYHTNISTALVPPSEYISSKITSKANRQLQDPIVFMTGNVPRWLTDIATICPFLLPFETRQLLFFTTAFDRERAMLHLQGQGQAGDGATSTENNDRVGPRLEKRRRLVSRTDLLSQATQVLDELSGSRALLEIHYQDEVGTGLGPTLEFYALISQQLQHPDLSLWRTGAGLLYPAPLGRQAKVSTVTKVRQKFALLGKLMARAVMDSRILDLPLSPVFYKHLLGQQLTARDLKDIDLDLARSYSQLMDIVEQKKRIENDKTHTVDSRTLALSSLSLDGSCVEDLCLDFVLPGYPGVELMKGGKETAVTLGNLEQYLDLVTHWTLYEGVARQMDAFKEGFEATFALSNLATFYPQELEAVFCGCRGQESWDVRYLSECCRVDHGFTVDSPTIQYLFEVLSSYGPEQRRQFILFVTGSPRLPVGGLRSLSPQLTIVRKVPDQGDPDTFLPSVMTCVNYLKLPEYSSVNVLRQRLDHALTEGQYAFHLS